MTVLRIFVADDHEVVRKGLISLLQAQPNWSICGEAADGHEAVEKAQRSKPDVVILDVGMPRLNGLEATRQLLKANPEARVLILTLHESEQMVREVLNAGARGFVLKSDAARDLVFAVEALAHDKTYFTSKVSTIVLDGYLRSGMATSQETVGHHRLTAREREIIQLVAEGKSSKEIAVALGLAARRQKRTAPISCANWSFIP